MAIVEKRKNDENGIIHRKFLVNVSNKNYFNLLLQSKRMNKIDLN